MMTPKPEKTAREVLQVWNAATAIEPMPGNALALLADTIAFGLSEGDFHPQQMLDRIQQTFDTLHIAKHIGRRH